MIKIKHIVMIYILFVILITTLSARIIIDKNKEINNLKEINKELKKNKYRIQVAIRPSTIND